MTDGRAMTLAVICQSLTTETRVQSQGSPRGICSQRIDNRRGSGPSTWAFSCQHHSTIAPHSFIHLPSTLYYYQLIESLNNTLKGQLQHDSGRHCFVIMCFTPPVQVTSTTKTKKTTCPYPILCCTCSLKRRNRP